MKKVIIHRPNHWFDRNFGYQVLINQQPVVNISNNQQHELKLPATANIEAKIMWCGSKVITINNTSRDNIQLRIAPNLQLHQLLLVTVAVSISCIVLASLFSQYELIRHLAAGLIISIMLIITGLVTIGRRRWIVLEEINQ